MAPRWVRQPLPLITNRVDRDPDLDAYLQTRYIIMGYPLTLRYDYFHESVALNRFFFEPQSVRSAQLGPTENSEPEPHAPPRSTSRFGSERELFLALVPVLRVIGQD
jgi:hypothetical protein